MDTKKLTPPTVRSGERVRERWEIEVSKLVTNSSITLDELAQLFFALNADNTSQLEARVDELERQLAIKQTHNYEVEINDLERRTVWDSLQKFS
jgi:hypothetical protein